LTAALSPPTLVVMSRRSRVAALIASVAVTSVIALAIWRPSVADPAARPGSAAKPVERGAATIAPVPIPGHEVYGFVPYWEMDDGIAAHLAATDLTTIGLFSVTHQKSGGLATAERGYRKITGELGRRIISEAHDRKVRVELVYSSFGTAKNAAFFASTEAQDRAIAALVSLAGDLEVDGINVDVESLDPGDLPAYGLFVGRLRAALIAAIPAARVSAATAANLGGTAMAVAASSAGADRIFMMGYDYRSAGSEPGASAPLGRRDGSEKDLPWSLDLYRDVGVPVDRTILGLPLYGMSWPIGGSGAGAPAGGRGTVWIPRRNLEVLASPSSAPVYDPIESVEVLTIQDAASGQAIYFDSPASLTPKLALADARGLAGAGFWAIGYERGLPDYTRLIASFRAGEIATSAAGR
jgi:spore germination protein YaaH